MLVYSKQSFRVSPRQLARVIRTRVESQPLPDLQQAREWLVATGQLEQAVLDADGDNGEASAATLAAADLFLSSRMEPQLVSSCRKYVVQLVLALQAVEKNCTSCELDVRVPEGFAWYALYPDSYAQTAERWARRFGSLRPDVCVIGLRSIGTTLAAVVAQALRRCGLTVTHCTSLRTTGTPFSRRAELPSGLLPALQNIIVDEGPGLSGSSMVAVASALEEAGADREAIHFFAGHANSPGPAANEDVRRWWRKSRIWTTDPDTTIIHGCRLPDALSTAAETFASDPAIGPAEPLGPEGWRTLAGLKSLPRAIAPGFETPKKLVRLSSGRAVLLKFAGFALTSSALSPNEPLHEHRTSRHAVIAPFGSSHGWSAVPWVEGVRLTPRDGSPQFLTGYLGPWIAGSAVDDMSAEEVRAALFRIAAALEAWAAGRGRKQRAGWFESIVERECARARMAPQSCYGDGRLAPHEWIRTPSDLIRKADHWPHQCDHTWVGRQPIAWDLAGAEIEWELDEHRAQALRQCVQNLTTYSCSTAALAFYKAGYCVFRAAAAINSANMVGDTRLREHLLAACNWYEERLESALATVAAELARE